MKYKCDQCVYVTNIKDSMQTHNMTKHQGVRFECDQCESSYSQERDLKRHILSIHSVDHPNESPMKIQCEQCYFITNRLSTLKEHKPIEH